MSHNEECLRRGVPVDFHQLDKPVRSDFDGTDELFYRAKQSDVVNEIIATTAFDVRRMSVNCNRFHPDPRSVLYSADLVQTFEEPAYKDRVIASTTIAEIWNISIPGQEGKKGFVYTVSVEHMPEPCIYPHCELVVSENGVEKKHPENPNWLKSALRLAYSDRIRPKKN